MTGIIKKFQKLSDLAISSSEIFGNAYYEDLTDFCNLSQTDIEYLTKHLGRKNFGQERDIAMKYCSRCNFENFQVSNEIGEAKHKEGDPYKRLSSKKAVGAPRTNATFFYCTAKNCSDRTCQKTRYNPLHNSDMSTSGFSIRKYAKILREKLIKPADIEHNVDCENPTARKCSYLIKQKKVYELENKKVVGYKQDLKHSDIVKLNQMKQYVSEIRSTLFSIESDIKKIENDISYRCAFNKLSEFIKKSK